MTIQYHDLTKEQSTDFVITTMLWSSPVNYV